MLLDHKDDEEFRMTSALKEVIRAALKPTVAWRLTEVRWNEATHRIAGILGAHLHHIGYARNELDAHHIRRFALANNKRSFQSIIVIVLHPQQASNIQKGR